MNGLEMVEQYFLRELTEAEEQALEEVLEVSPDAAELFQEKAEAAYLRYGLPEPSLPPQEPPGSSSAKPFKWLWILAGAGLLATGAWWWSRGQEIHWPWDPSETESQYSPADQPVQKTSPAKTNPGSILPTEGMGTDLDQDPEDQAVPEDENQNAVTPAPAPPARDNQGHPGLRVIVERRTPGLVTVTVLDPVGNEVRMLYAGILQAGRWSFEWNGQLANGNRAPIGAYTIQVQSGSVVQKQEVWVDK